MKQQATYTRIKFCGFTRETDVRQACSLGVDAVGFVFCEESPRFVSVELAQSLSAACGPFVARVGLFLNQSENAVQSILEKVDLDVLQFHGSEEESYCRSFAKPYLKSVPMREPEALERYRNVYSSAQALLVDNHEADAMGGTGQTFDWNDVSSDDSVPLIVAGGLSADNVAEAIEKIHPYGVDVSSGIEKEKGIKDLAKMRSFVTAVKSKK